VQEDENASDRDDARDRDNVEPTAAQEQSHQQGGEETAEEEEKQDAQGALQDLVRFLSMSETWWLAYQTGGVDGTIAPAAYSRFFRDGSVDTGLGMFLASPPAFTGAQVTHRKM